MLQETHQPEDYTVLVVDNLPANLRLLTAILSRRGYRVRVSANGQQALTTIQKAAPDLILLDVMMPLMDGYEVCRRLKADETTQHIPVIFVSAMDKMDDKVTAFSVGAVDYITKPVEDLEVLARVRTHLSLNRMQQRLQAQNQQLKEQNADLNAFAHTVAHDLQTPLSKLITALELIQELMPDDSTSADLTHLLSMSVNSGRKMSSIIKELLFLASVRKEDFSLSALSMPDIITEVLERHSDQIKGSHAEISLPQNWPQALGYTPWVEEVWANYLSNALKYGGTPPQITLGAKALPQGQLKFWVQDNGPGLTQSEVSKLFEEFQRGDGVHHQQIEGTGLGLSIVRRIIHKLGGQVGVESIPGQGSLFYFTLPPVESPAVTPKTSQQS